jgi:hypothetical protein
MMNAALTYYNANNLGDEIQTLAAMQFIKPEVFVNRDNISNETRNVKLIGNGFWDELQMIKDYNTDFNPPENIKMLPISIHLRRDNINLSWFKKNQPIGARDTDTMKFLQDNGIDAYFSGCLTLTLPEYKGNRDKKILFVGMTDDWKNVNLPKEYEIERLSPVNQIQKEESNDPIKRLEKAKCLLEKYRKASLVISSRIHAIMPCIALGTPVIAVRIERNKKRLSGYDFIPNHRIHDIKNVEDYKIQKPVKLIRLLKNKVIEFSNKNR